MTKANFFIIGAPKCGTTSMATWLAEHPEVYFSPIKEPHYFNSDHSHRSFGNLEEYQTLYADATGAEKAVGEASVWYLTSKEAVPNILQYNPQARFIVMVRNPLQMAPSLHDQMVFSQYEHIRDFARAWRHQNARKKGHDIKKSCLEGQFLIYGERCKLGVQLKRLYDRVDKKQVHVILFDELKANPKEEYVNTLAFLGLTDDGRDDFSVQNPAKERRSHLVRDVVKTLGSAKRKLGITGGLGILNAIDNKNIQVRTRQDLPMELQREMIDYFADDVALLAKLIGKNLDHWLEIK